MYAVIEQGSKQYKVAAGDTINIELTDVDPKAETIEMDKVLMVSDGKDVKLGTPYLEGAKVVGKFDSSADEAIVKGQKLFVSHRRRRKNSKTRVGHRQKYMKVTVEEIKA